MNKAILKQRWSKYTDTDKLVDDIMKLLNKCNFRHTEHGICTMLDTYFTNKEPLIKLLQKSNNYAGDMRIVAEKEFERDNNRNNIANEVCWFCSNTKADLVVKKREDEFGKTLQDYLTTGVTHLKASELEDIKLLKKFAEINKNTIKYDSNGFTKESCTKYNNFCNVLRVFESIYESNLSIANVNAILTKDSTLKVASGMKTSRAFNHVCNVYGVDKAPEYNKVFAKYADLVSGLKRKLKFVISVNPYDYLTMSFGNSWTSCHNIKNHGGWCGGTMSYMLDSTSIITYCVGKDDNVQTDNKIYRTMFAYGNNVLLQSRVYPQGNDGNKDLYKVFRTLVQAELTELLSLEKNKWYVSTGGQACREATTSYGVHYKDYFSNRCANVSYPVEKSGEAHIHDGSLVIGHNGICVYCGHEITQNGTLAHSDCTLSHEEPEDDDFLEF